MSQQHDASNSSKSGAVGPVTVALASVGAALAPAAEAATFTVTNTNDSGAGSLRQAIEDANADTAADTIVFQAGVTGTITLTTGQLEITESVTITGPGAANLTVSGNNASRVFYLYNGSDVISVEISGLTISGGNTGGSGGGLVNWYENLTLDSVIVTGNTAEGPGGGIALFSGYEGDAVTIRNATISNNSGSYGGGIYVEDTGAPLLIVDSTITGNTAASNGGGIYFYDPDYDVSIERTTITGNTAEGNLGRAPTGGSGNVYGDGGGIGFYSADGGTFRIVDSTVSGNAAGDGGGVYMYNADRPFEIVNTTISGNTADDNGGGIGFYYAGDDTGRIAHSTITGNYSSDDGGGIYAYDGFLDITHSIVAGNDSDSGFRNLDSYNGEFDATFSIVGDVGNPAVNDNGGNQFGVDPLLGPLANNGGPTQTHLPLAGSPAIDAGDPNFMGPPNTDQAGNPRVVGGGIDIGALEVQAAAPLVPQVPVPALGLLGMAAAALGVGGIGAAAARRRKQRTSGPLAAMALAVALAAGLHAPAAEARQRPETTRVATTLSSLVLDGATARIALANGQSVNVDASKLVIRDTLRGSAGTRAPGAIQAGQAVVVKTKYNRDGSVREVRVRLFKSLDAAQRSIARK